MKNLILVFIILITTETAFSQWPFIEQTSGVTTQLTSSAYAGYGTVYFFPDYGWICGYNSVVLKTTNGGVNWINVGVNGITPGVSLINIFALNENIVMTAGYIGSNTYGFRTSNGGANWTQVFYQPGGFINAVWLNSSGTGFMTGDPVGSRWSMWKTTNNGAAWDSTGLYLQQAGTETGFNNSLSVSYDRIWFGTNSSKIYYSTNSGLNFIPITVPVSSVYSIFMDGMGNGIAGGENLIKTTNNGSNWTLMTVPGTGNISGVSGIYGLGPLWYVRGPSIYSGNIFGFNLAYTAPAGTYRFINPMLNSFKGSLFAVRNNGGISKAAVIIPEVKILHEKVIEKLYQNYPNPFNPKTKIFFEISYTGNVSITVFDLLGRKVETLMDEKLNTGRYNVKWDGSAYPAGVYFYNMIINGKLVETKKMLLIK
jgi:hypothetical protein